VRVAFPPGVEELQFAFIQTRLKYCPLEQR
jgi:hypothetical protein